MQVGRNGEGQADVHSAAIAFNRRVEELLDIREPDDVVKLALYLLGHQPQDCAVQVDILAPRQLRVKTRPHLE